MSISSFLGYDAASSFLHPERGYDAARQSYEDYYNKAQNYGKPYNEAGQSEIGRLKDATGRLLDPSALLNEWSKGYETSPYAKDELARSSDLGLDAASAMGLSGSSSGLENIQRTGSHIVNADRKQYLDDLMQKYLNGIQSSTNIFNTGAQTAQGLGQNAINTGQHVAEARYGATNAPGELFGRGAGMAIGALSGNPGATQYQPWRG